MIRPQKMAGDPLQNQDLSFLAVLYASMLCALFGANAVAIKIAVPGVGAFTTAGIRFSIASVAISLWALATGQSFHFNRKQAYHLLACAVIFTVQLSFFYLGISKTNASRGTLIVNLVPFLVLFLAHFFIPGDRITLRKTLGILMGFSGVAFVFLEKRGVTADLRIGDLLVLMTALLWACQIIYTKRIIGSFHPFQIILYPMVFSIPFFFFAGFLWDGTMIAHMDYRVVLSLLYQGLVTGSFGLVVWNYMLLRYGATALHSFLFIMPFSGVLLGGFVLGEPITANILVALLLVASGILAVNLRPQAPAPVSPV